uniref:Uncharacterized protein n=1 Tax=Ursus maritimus TaxID=29073 RepID=A0A452SYC5_URSMA
KKTKLCSCLSSHKGREVLGVESLTGTDWIHHSFSGSRILENVFHPSPPLRTLHTVTRIEHTRRRPACGKDTMNVLGLEKAHTPPVHKNIPPGNAKLKAVEPSVTVKALRLPQGLPAEEAAFPAPQGATTQLLAIPGAIQIAAAETIMNVIRSNKGKGPQNYLGVKSACSKQPKLIVQKREASVFITHFSHSF